ncbi:MAG TPA: metallophosphoesterase family protein [Anaerolineaceae bacterium]|nr:metallophosphoesterase family protein [Anaerolineaceae bacterium]
MQIGILSDTHNHSQNLQAAMRIFKQKDVQTIFHCGDLTRVEFVPLLADFRVIYLAGNGDLLWGEIRQSLLDLNPENFGGLVFEGEIEGVRIAAAHGQEQGVLDNLTRSGEYDYVFYGHSHRHKDLQVGRTRLINPGALGGLKVEPRSICLLDLESGQSEFIDIL